VGHGLIHRFGSIGDRPDDPPPERLRHRLLVYMGALMACGAVVWCGLSFAFGFREAAAIPAFYIVLTAVNFTAFGAWKRFAPTAFMQVLASVLLPFAFQWSVGGFHATGATMLWAFVAVVGSLTFTSPRELVKWLALYLVLAVASGFVDGAARARTVVAVSDDVKVAFLVANIVMISAVTLALIFYFLDQRERAVHALAQAKERIEDLRKEVADARQLGQYTLVAKLGSGAMGTVYLASHAMLRRPTAIKLVRRERVDEATLARFEREVQLTATLTHPNVVTVYDYGRTSAGMFYYVMEYLGGADLGVIVERHGAMPAARCLRILVQTADALAEAHKQGLIHRDVKPANVILVNGWEPDVVKVVDFGLVKQVAGPRASGSLTPESSGPVHSVPGDADITGTPAYMSPEAIDTPGKVDGRSDVYSVGCLAYYLMTGKEVFAAKSWVDLWSHHLYTPPVPPSVQGGVDVPRPLEELVLACLAKSPAARPSMAELATRLRGLEAEARAGWSASDAAAWWEKHGAGLVAERQRSGELDLTIVARAPRGRPSEKQPTNLEKVAGNAA
jgi:serine/threonine protein kinase